MVSDMKQQLPAPAASPLGEDPRVSAGRRRARNPRYAELEKKLELSLAIADLSILHRTRQNLTQKQLAERMGTSETAISRLEAGFHNPTLDTLHKLAQALGGHGLARVAIAGLSVVAAVAALVLVIVTPVHSRANNVATLLMLAIDAYCAYNLGSLLRKPRD
jgi:transcriptional regulator with XRE-family HTH domain